MLQYLTLFIRIVHSAWVLTLFFVLCFFNCWRNNICNKIRQPKEGNHISSKGEYYSVQIRKLLKELHDKLGMLCAVLIFHWSVRCWLLLYDRQWTNRKCCWCGEPCVSQAILPEYCIVLHFCPESYGSLCPGGQLCQGNKLMFFSVPEEVWRRENGLPSKGYLPLP